MSLNNSKELSDCEPINHKTDLCDKRMGQDKRDIYVLFQIK